MTHLNYSLKKLGKSFKLPNELLKTVMNHDETDETYWKDKRDVWLLYVKKDVLCTAYSYARYNKFMEKINRIPDEKLSFFTRLRMEIF